MSWWIKPKSLRTSRHHKLRSNFLGEDKKGIGTREVLEGRLSKALDLISHVRKEPKTKSRVHTSLRATYTASSMRASILGSVITKLKLVSSVVPRTILSRHRNITHTIDEFEGLTQVYVVREPHELVPPML